MMKKVVLSFAAVLLAFVMVTASALAYNAKGVVDDAELLTYGEEKWLQEKLDDVYQNHQFQVVLHTVDGIQGQPIHLYAADFYDYNGYGEGSTCDGMIFVIDMDEREYVTVTTGMGIPYFSDRAIASMEENIVEDLSAGNYYEAFCAYLDQVEQQLNYVKTQPVVYFQEPLGDFDYVDAYDYYGDEVTQETRLAIAAGFSGIVTSIVLSVMVGRMKTARKKAAASDYVQGARFNRETDTYLYSTTRKRRVQSSSSSSGGGSSTFRSSSGRSHGGGRSGRF